MTRTFGVIHGAVSGFLSACGTAVRSLDSVAVGTPRWSCIISDTLNRTLVRRSTWSRAPAALSLLLLRGPRPLIHEDLVSPDCGIQEASWNQDCAIPRAFQLIQGPVQSALSQSFSKNICQTTFLMQP